MTQTFQSGDPTDRLDFSWSFINILPLIAYTIAEGSIGIIVHVIIDTCNHIIAKSAFGSIPSPYGECIQILLQQNQIISTQLAKDLILAIAMRNVIIHRYLEVDLVIIFNLSRNY